jgi:hypothetical protein
MFLSGKQNIDSRSKKKGAIVMLILLSSLKTFLSSLLSKAKTYLEAK